MSLQAASYFKRVFWALLTSSIVVMETGVEAALIVSVEKVGTTAHSAPVLIEGGFGEDVKAFSDRFHQWNGVSTTNDRRQPTLAGLGLVGKDYVQTANDARGISASQGAYRVTLAEEAQVFLFVDTRMAVPDWVASMGFVRIANGGTNGEYWVGYDEYTQGATNDDLAVGPGVSINTQAWVYTARLGAGEHVFNGMGFAGNNNYGIVATKAGTVVGGVARVAGTNSTPALQRLAFGTGVKAFVDRDHLWVMQSTVLDALPGLQNADYIQLSNDARGASASSPLYEVTLLETSVAYLFLDNRYFGEHQVLHEWITALNFTDSGQELWIDEFADGSLNQTAKIYTTTLAAGVYSFNGLDMSSSMNQYGLAFHAVPEPVRGCLLLMAGGWMLGVKRRRAAAW